MAGVINFVERQRSFEIYDFLVFVCGVDVSPYVQTLDIHYCDRAGINSADITLLNPFDQWVLTNQNFANIWRTTNVLSDRYSETAKYNIYKAKKNLSYDLTVATFAPNANAFSTPSQAANKVLLQAQRSDFLQRYAFGPNSVVFSKFDPVKIFIRNPFAADTNDSQWMPAFTGTLENKPFNTNYVTGASSIQLTCYDIRAAMSGMRVAVNPYQNSFFQGNPNRASFGATVGLFQDLYLTQSDGGVGRDQAFDNIFYGMNYVDAQSLLVTGQVGWVNGGSAVQQSKVKGIGNFQPGQVVRYAPASVAGPFSKPVVSNLEDWDNLCLFGEGDAEGNTPAKTWWTRKQCIFAGKNSFWGQEYSPIEGSLHWLIPADGLTITDMITGNGPGVITAEINWTNRFDLMNQMAKQVDYEMTVTGNGDIIMEFPMYDFDPSHFGNNSTIYTLDHHVVSDQISDETGQILSALEINSVGIDIASAAVDRATQAAPSIVQPSDTKRAVIVNDVLAARYGARVQNATYAGVTSLNQLIRLGMIDFHRRLAEANKCSFEMSFRPFIRPNRPILHKTRNRLGKSSTVQLTFPALQECKSSIQLSCVRLPVVNTDGSIGYQHISGGSGFPISYNQIYEGAAMTGVSSGGTLPPKLDITKYTDPNSGTYAVVPNGTPPTVTPPVAGN